LQSELDGRCRHACAPPCHHTPCAPAPHHHMRTRSTAHCCYRGTRTHAHAVRTAHYRLSFVACSHCTADTMPPHTACRGAVGARKCSLILTCKHLACSCFHTDMSLRGFSFLFCFFLLKLRGSFQAFSRLSGSLPYVPFPLCHAAFAGPCHTFS